LKKAGPRFGAGLFLSAPVVIQCFSLHKCIAIIPDSAQPIETANKRDCQILHVLYIMLNGSESVCFARPLADRGIGIGKTIYSASVDAMICPIDRQLGLFPFYGFITASFTLHWYLSARHTAIQYWSPADCA
jgi:hypothetical protein